jgi:anti-sigma B factor antagonist
MTSSFETSPFEASVRCCDGAAVLDLRGELDLASAPAVWDQIIDLFLSGRSDSLVVDLSDVTFIDSSGLGVLLRATQLLQPPGSMLVRGPAQQARRLFELAGVESVLTIVA